MRKTELVPLKDARTAIIAALVCLTGWGAPVWGQEAVGVGGVRSFGISSSYSPNSSHILIGEADQRRTWTLGVEYTRLLHLSPRFRLDYEGSLMPLYLESDPTLTATFYAYKGQSYVATEPPVRVLSVDHGPVGSVPTGPGSSIPLYALYGRQATYAAAFAPLGARISALPRRRVQPSFALDMGFVVSARDIPVDEADQFNYMFAFGPGVQVFSSARSSLRLEYLYRHVSNAHMGYENPGVDQGVFRLTISRRW